MPAEAGDRFEDFQMLEKSAVPFAKDNPKIPVNGRSLLHSQPPSKTKNSFPNKKNKQSR